MNEITTQIDLEKFLHRYSEFVDKQFEERLNTFKLSFNHVRAGIESLKSMAAEYERQYATSFNVFDALGVGHKEVTTHSALLVELLNPEGSHGQGRIFLETFLEHLKSLYPSSKANDQKPPFGFLDSNSIKNGTWRIEKEKNTSHGFLDIVLVEQEQQIAIVIENKIYAGDQKDQLKRYLTWIEKSKYSEKGRLLYLTIDGHQSDESKCKPGEHYLCLSYRSDIAGWIHKSLNFVSAFRIRDLLKQYMALINKL